MFTNAEFNNYKLYAPNTATPLNNLPDTFMPASGGGGFMQGGNGSSNGYGGNNIQNTGNWPNPLQWFNGSHWGFGSPNTSTGQSAGNSGNNNNTSTSQYSGSSNQLSCGNNWPSSGYLYVTITPPPGFTQLDARKLASALQNNNWNFQGYQSSAQIQINVGYIGQNGNLQPYGYACNQSLPANTVVEIIGPIT